MSKRYARNGEHVVLVDGFTVAPEHTDELVAALKGAIDEAVCHLPGFISASLHVGMEDRSVMTCSHWTTARHAHAMQRDDHAQSRIAEAAKIGRAEGSQLYRVAHRFSDDDLPPALTGPSSLPI